MAKPELQSKVDRAAELERAGRHDEAIALLDQVLAVDPAFPWARQNRGNNWFLKRDLDRAIEDYRLSTALLPSERDPWYNLGVACLHKGDRVGGVTMVASGLRVVSPNDTWYQQAIAAFSRALQIQPKDTRALVMRAYAHVNRLDLPNARADFGAAAAAGDPVAKRELKDRWGVDA